MKIIHTADWHIGKRLHKHDLSKDFYLFIEWLIDLVKEKKVDVVLVSGDIFDLANPSSEARKAYFQTLLKLHRLNCKVIITGGNHDSPAVLNGPKELLQAMDIHVVGSLPESIEDCLIPLYHKNGKVETVIAALPYLRDADLRSVNEEFGYENRLEATREGIARIFNHAAITCEKEFNGIPAIAMGHLFAAGVSTSESEREIQVGNEASFDATGFGDYFSYVALGHIHKPQKVSASIPVLYSGSPIPLSFSEREDLKRLLIIDTEHFEVESIDIPVFRQLKRVSGSLNELVLKLGALKPKGDLDMLLELELIEDQYDPAKIIDLDRLVQEFSIEGAEIVKHRATCKNKIKGSTELYSGSEQLEDLKPSEVFDKLLKHEEFDEDTNELIKSAFNEILEEVYNSDQH